MWCNTSLSGPSAIRGTTQAVLGAIPSGTAGAVATMRRMRQLVLDAVRDPKQGIREKALSIIGRTGYVDQARRLQQWVQDHIRYVRDPPDVELIQTPQYTLQQEAGDCDDQATLLAAYLQATGHPAQFYAVGLSGGPLSHVLVRTLIGSKWVGAETILRKPLGWMPDNVTSWYPVNV